MRGLRVRDSDFAEFAAGRWETLVRSAVLLGARPHEAEDLAQQTLLKCYTGWARVQRASHQNAYVTQILLNELRRSQRRRWTGEIPTSEVPDSEMSDHADIVAATSAVAASLGRLTTDQRDTVVLRYYLQLSERQIADLLRVAPGTVKSRLSRAISALATDAHLRDLEEQGDVDGRARS